MLWFLGGVLVLSVAFLFVTTLFKQLKLEADYESRAFHGRLVGLQYTGRDQYVLTIKQDNGDTLSYPLHITWFIKENNIQVNDSLSKGSDTYAMRFYKKQNGVYVSFVVCMV
ncbi:MAG: hypothetical protein JSS79_18615 [Bacteroidetes bacterium]|nr:hypothetical protein [Bacteroidota bacterium]